jgi:hypothetical protein
LPNILLAGFLILYIVRETIKTQNLDMMWFRSIVTISLLVFLSTSVQSEVSASKEKCFGKDCIAATVSVLFVSL